jgi:hypothetical protein
VQLTNCKEVTFNNPLGIDIERFGIMVESMVAADREISVKFNSAIHLKSPSEFKIFQRIFSEISATAGSGGPIRASLPKSLEIFRAGHGRPYFPVATFEAKIDTNGLGDSFDSRPFEIEHNGVKYTVYASKTCGSGPCINGVKMLIPEGAREIPDIVTDMPEIVTD